MHERFCTELVGILLVGAEGSNGCLFFWHLVCQGRTFLGPSAGLSSGTAGRGAPWASSKTKFRVEIAEFAVRIGRTYLLADYQTSA